MLNSIVNKMLNLLKKPLITLIRDKLFNFEINHKINCSSSGMFAETRTDAFQAVMHMRIASLTKRGSANSLLNAPQFAARYIATGWGHMSRRWSVRSEGEFFNSASLLILVNCDIGYIAHKTIVTNPSENESNSEINIHYYLSRNHWFAFYDFCFRGDVYFTIQNCQKLDSSDYQQSYLSLVGTSWYQVYKKYIHNEVTLD